MIVDAVEALLRDRWTPGGDAAAFSRVVEEAGFLDLLRSEEEGGAALPLREFFPVVVQLGRHAAPAEIVEAMAARALNGRHPRAGGGPGEALPLHAHAALHAALIAGAMTRCFELTLAWCNQRTQFGRTLGKFQAIQHQLAEMAELVVAVGIAAEAAFQAQDFLLLPAAIAKARASEAAVFVANTAHALHGAIGITAEYELQHHTRHLHAWRIAHGSENHWNRRVGELLLASGQGVADFVIHPRSSA